MKKELLLNGKWDLIYDTKKIEIDVPSVLENKIEKNDFFGPFTYEKIIKLENLEKNKKYFLEFRGVSYYCEIYLNNKNIGSHEGIWDSFEFDITNFLTLGENVLKVKVTKPDFDKNSKYFYRSVLFGFIPDISMPFGGIWKDVKIHIVENGIRDIIKTSDKRCELSIDLYSNMKTDEILQIEIFEKNNLEFVVKKEFKKLKSGKNILELDIKNIKFWSPLNPNLYIVKVSLITKEKELDSKTKQIGFKNISVIEENILLDGTPYRMRGALHWGQYEDRISPTPTYEEVKEELLRAKELGFNTIKHCLYFPPEYYYELCDEMGFVTWQELPLWLPVDTEYMNERIYSQYPKMLEYFMQYPTVSIVSLGCELDSTIKSHVLDDLYNMVRKMDSVIPICANSGNGSGECFGGEASKTDVYAYHFYPEAHYMKNLVDTFSPRYREAKPWIFGEFNDTDLWRDSEKLKRKHGELWWLSQDEHRNLLRQTHKGFGSDQPVYRQKEILEENKISYDELNDLEKISLEASYIYRKYIFETIRKSGVVCGYNITVIKDTPITTSGIFTIFNEDKWSPNLIKNINDDFLLAIEPMNHSEWKNGGNRVQLKDEYNFFSKELLSKKIILSNWSEKEFKDCNLEITFLRADEKKEIRNINIQNIIKFSAKQIADFTIELPEVKKIEFLQIFMKLTIKNKDKEEIILNENGWKIWIHPPIENKPKLSLYDPLNILDGLDKNFEVEEVDILNLSKYKTIATTFFDERLEEFVKNGGNVFHIETSAKNPLVKIFPFWREGIKIVNIENKLISTFANSNVMDIQFLSVGNEICFNRIKLLEKYGEYTSLIRRVDGRKYNVEEYMFETKIGKGKYIGTTLRLMGGIGNQPTEISNNILGLAIINGVINYAK